MRPPFSSDQFFGVFARYNEVMWPLQLLLVTAAITLVIVAVAIPRRSRIVMAGLGVAKP